MFSTFKFLRSSAACGGPCQSLIVAIILDTPLPSEQFALQTFVLAVAIRSQMLDLLAGKWGRPWQPQ